MEIQGQWISMGIERLVAELEPKVNAEMETHNFLEKLKTSRQDEYVGDPDFDDLFTENLHNFLKTSYTIIELFKDTRYQESLESMFDVPLIKQRVLEGISQLAEGNYKGVRDNIATTGMYQISARVGAEFTSTDEADIIPRNTLGSLYSNLLDISEEIEDLTFPVPEGFDSKLYRGIYGLITKTKHAAKAQMSEHDNPYAAEIDVLKTQYVNHPEEEEITKNIDDFYMRYSHLTSILDNPQYKMIFDLFKEKDGLGIGGIVRLGLDKHREQFTKQEFGDPELESAGIILTAIMNNSNPDYVTKKVLVSTVSIFEGMQNASQNMLKITY